MKNKILCIIILLLIILYLITLSVIVRTSRQKEIICYKDICIDTIRKVCFPNE